MNLDGKTLAEWLRDQPASAFPPTHDYRSGYATLVTFLNKNVHSQVTPTNIHIDGGYLTDHGPDHIEKLIERISALLLVSDGEISAYEAYILLVAAQFHDVGNIFGREKHEEKSASVMEDAGALLGIDTVERRVIHKIAQAHGGENKDKLSTLSKVEHVNNKPVRSRLLAAILKFGDELAEDSQRAARYSRAKDLLPPESALYHAYAEALNSVTIDGPAASIAMRFELPRKNALQQFLKKGRDGKPDRQVYLIDEILARTLKTHCERLYCSRFMRPFIDLNAVSVAIEVTSDNGFNVLKKISYRLEETGYPESRAEDIYDLCPDLTNLDGLGRLNGDSLAAYLGNAHAS